MIVRQQPPTEILAALCNWIGPAVNEAPAAFYLLPTDRFGSQRWVLAAGPFPGDEAGLDPESLSESLFGAGDSTQLQAIGRFRARHLFSGIGELVGLFVLVADTDPDPFAANRIETVCRLAALAVEQRNLLDELAWQADHDDVTGLLTRGCFERMLAARLPAPRAARFQALLIVNLDRFRLVNEVLGHSLGNRVLRQVGSRFSECLPAGCALARVGGDEFAVLPDICRSPDDAAGVAEAMIRALTEQISVDEHQLFISASIGIACSTTASTRETLQREAYIALYHAKQSGKARWMCFHPSMAATPPERLETEKRLRSALERGEMMLFYQPQYELASGRLRGAEVLLRWKPEGLGIISPACFIPILEETGLIVEFGAWVVREACRQGRRWGDEMSQWLRLAVNVSALQFMHPGFPAEVEGALRETGFPPALLELELTESLLIADYARVSSVFRRLQKLGVTMALDDFGVGQSSLSHLQRLPFQRLKIDQSFVRSMAEGGKCPPIVENIVRLAAGLGMETIAEGVDSQAQVDALQRMGCQEAQGYFYSMPVPAADFERTWPKPEAASA
jgi:diguanylate cyclase (GGDEF)-like protein